MFEQSEASWPRNVDLRIYLSQAATGISQRAKRSKPVAYYKVMLLPITKERVSADGTMEEAMVDENKFPRKYRTSDTSGLSHKVSANASFNVEMK